MLIQAVAPGAPNLASKKSTTSFGRIHFREPLSLEDVFQISFFTPDAHFQTALSNLLDAIKQPFGLEGRRQVQARKETLAKANERILETINLIEPAMAFAALSNLYKGGLLDKNFPAPVFMALYQKAIEAPKKLDAADELASSKLDKRINGDTKALELGKPEAGKEQKLLLQA